MDFIKKHSATILTVTASVGVGLTTYFAINGTIKAVKLVNKVEQENHIKLNKKDIIKTTWKLYIPTFVSGLTTIGCIFGINVLNQKQQQSLAAAYTALYSNFEKYRKEIQEKYGKDVDANSYSKAIKSDRLKAISDLVQPGQEIFYDVRCDTFYISTIDEVTRIGEEFIAKMERDGFGLINEYYRMIGLPEVPYGWSLGWSGLLEDCEPYGCHKMDFTYELVHVDKGLYFWLVDYNTSMTWNYI